jgi:hypothetical protein
MTVTQPYMTVTIAQAYSMTMANLTFLNPRYRLSTIGEAQLCTVLHCRIMCTQFRNHQAQMRVKRLKHQRLILIDQLPVKIQGPAMQGLAWQHQGKSIWIHPSALTNLNYSKHQATLMRVQGSKHQRNRQFLQCLNEIQGQRDMLREDTSSRKHPRKFETKHEKHLQLLLTKCLLQSTSTDEARGLLQPFMWETWRSRHPPRT